MDVTAFKGSRGVKVPISTEEENKILGKSVHTQHKDYQKLLDSVNEKKELHMKTMKKKVLVPVEETIQVPVFRKEASRGTKKVIVQGKRLFPVTKYKEVEETVLDVQEEMVGKHKEKRAAPVTRLRKIPYTDFEERIVDIEVEVPADEVVMRKGFREDKHVVSKIVEVEEDLHYEMRPVLVKKGDKRMKEVGDHHSFKTSHGPPAWDAPTGEAWLSNRLKTPTYRPDLPRPQSAQSILSVASSMVVPRLRQPRYIDAPPVKAPKYQPGRSVGQMKASSSTGALRSSGQ
jgi:hypothetical protein